MQVRDCDPSKRHSQRWAKDSNRPAGVRREFRRYSTGPIKVDEKFLNAVPALLRNILRMPDIAACPAATTGDVTPLAPSKPNVTMVLVTEVEVLVVLIRNLSRFGLQREDQGGRRASEGRHAQQTAPQGRSPEPKIKEPIMTTILIIVVVILLFGGGGYGYTRWRG